MRPNHKPCRESARRGVVVDRRAFLQAAAGAAGLTLTGAAPPAERATTRQLGIPGPFPGRVVEVRDPASVRQGVPDAQAVRRMIARGMVELTGIAEPVEAWRSMFEP